MQQKKDIFQQAEKRYAFKTILFSHTDQTPWAEQFLTWISQDPSWKITYFDETMVILQKNSGTALIDDPSRIQPYSTSLPSLFKLAHFFSLIGWKESQKATLHAVLTHDPDNCPVLLNRALVAQQENDPMLSFFAKQYQVKCR